MCSIAAAEAIIPQDSGFSDMCSGLILYGFIAIHSGLRLLRGSQRIAEGMHSFWFNLAPELTVSKHMGVVR